MITNVILDDSGKNGLIKGMNILGNAVGSTMGAGGKNVVYKNRRGMPEITGDGWEVAENIFLEGVEALGCEIMKEGARKTNEIAGDSTTLTMVMAQSLVNLSDEELNKKEKSASQIRAELLESKDKVISFLENLSVPASPQILQDVAKTSTRGDVELGKIVSDAYEKAGKYGSVTHTRSETDITYIDFIDGTLIESGYGNFEVFVNSFEDLKADWENPLVLLSEIEFNTFDSIKPFIIIAQQQNKPLVVVSEMNIETRTVLMQNFYQWIKTTQESPNAVKGFRVLVISPPESGSQRKEYLQDLALITNSQVLTTTAGKDLSQVAPNYLGTCKRFVSTKMESVIIPNAVFDLTKIDAKIKELEAIITNSNNISEKSHYEDRIAKLTGKIAIIKVGAGIESELKEKISRVEDAVKAVKCAKEKGVLAGGGIAMLKASNFLDVDSVTKESLYAPFNKILSNADIQLPIKKTEYPIGYDVIAKKEVNMFEAGIVDSAKGIISAYSNAVSIAITVLNTFCVITNKYDK
jgi:chaperonin GroEL